VARTRRVDYATASRCCHPEASHDQDECAVPSTTAPTGAKVAVTPTVDAEPLRSAEMEPTGRGPGAITHPYATVAEAMVRMPATHGPTATIDEARTELENPHRHLVLIVSGRRLLGTVDRTDLQGPLAATRPALSVARLEGRTARAEERLAAVHAEMAEADQRRRAVVDEHGTLLGLLCLKASGLGFCSDEGIAARNGSCADEESPSHGDGGPGDLGLAPRTASAPRLQRSGRRLRHEGEGDALV
jgi:hypothetical protein